MKFAYFPGSIGVATLLFNHGLEQGAGLPRTDSLNGYGSDGSKQLRDFLGIGDFGVVVFGVGVDQGKHEERVSTTERDADVGRIPQKPATTIVWRQTGPRRAYEIECAAIPLPHK